MSPRGPPSVFSWQRFGRCDENVRVVAYLDTPAAFGRYSSLGNLRGGVKVPTGGKARERSNPQTRCDSGADS